MHELMDKNVIEVIREYKEVGDILNEFGIGCTACTLGTCALKDIVEYHYLPPEKELELWGKVAVAVGADPAEMRPPAKERKGAALRGPGGAIKYSPPVKMLVDEHSVIKRLLALVPGIASSLDLGTEDGRGVVLGAVDFIRGYADKFHHAKEEDILFKYFDENLDVLKVMHEEHEVGRGHVRAVVEGVERRDAAAVVEHLRGYMVLLTEHISKEDEILYPWMDGQLTDRQVGEMFGAFRKVEADAPEGTPEKYVKFVEDVEKRFGK